MYVQNEIIVTDIIAWRTCSLSVSMFPLYPGYSGPYEIASEINDLNCIVKSPARRKKIMVCVT